jgi:hypothetical protein
MRNNDDDDVGCGDDGLLCGSPPRWRCLWRQKDPFGIEHPWFEIRCGALLLLELFATSFATVLQQLKPRRKALQLQVLYSIVLHHGEQQQRKEMTKEFGLWVAPVLGHTTCDGTSFIHGDLNGDGVLSQGEVLRLL